MNRLNFYPYYKEYLKSFRKTTTFRLSEKQPFEQGDKVMISVGWREDSAMDIHPATITEVYRKRICDLINIDFDGESPDCKSYEATQLVLSCIYRTVLKESDEIWIVKFSHCPQLM